MLDDWLRFWGLNDKADPALIVHNDPKRSTAY
jgi:hypothetical protein